MIEKPLILGVAIPAVLSVLVIVGAWWSRRVESKSLGASGAGGLAVGLAYLAGHVLLFGWSPYPPEDSWDWLLYAVPVAIAIGWLTNLGRSGPWIAPALWLIGSVLAAYHLVPEYADLAERMTEWRIGLSLTILLLTFVTMYEAQRSPYVTPFLVGAVSACTAVLLLFGGIAKFSQLGGALATGIGGATFTACALRSPRAPASMMPCVAVVNVGLLFNGYFNSFSKIPVTCYAVLAFVIVGGLIADLPYIRNMKPWQGGIVRVLAVLIPLGWVMLKAWRIYSVESASSEDASYY